MPRTSNPRNLTEVFQAHTGYQASRQSLVAALAEDEPERRALVQAYLDGESPTTLASRRGITSTAIYSYVKYAMRACYARIYGTRLPTLNPDRPSREATRTGYRTDPERHKAARAKVPARRRKQIARLARNARDAKATAPSGAPATP